MKTILIYIVGMSFASAIYAQPIVKIKYSKPFAIIKFLETAKGGHGISQTFKQQIDTSLLLNTDEFRKLISDYSAINLDYNYAKDQYPDQRKHHTSTWDLLCIAAISSSSNEAFFTRLIGIYPNSDYLKLKQLVTKVEPFYDQFIYHSTKNAVEDKVKALEALSPKLNELFENYKVFYGSSWDKNIPFHLAIYPIAGHSGETTATPHANSLEMGVLTQDKDVVGLLSVAMHEMCHVLFEEQPIQLQQHLDSIFKENNTPIGKMAYRYIDEALATALGNGYAYYALSGSVDSLEWYNDPYINLFAKAIYPMTLQYMTAHKQIDKEFILKAINLFERTFPNAIYDLDALLMNVDIYFDASLPEEQQSLSAIIHSTFRVYSSNTSSPIQDAISLQAIKTSPRTQFILVHQNHSKNMAALKLLFKNLTTLPNQKNAVISFLDENGRAVIILLAENESKIQQGLQLLKYQREINPKKWWTSF